eukprot:scaffold222635_cov31-Tisochrysis_lutea.AAC.3
MDEPPHRSRRLADSGRMIGERSSCEADAPGMRCESWLSCSGDAGAMSGDGGTPRAVAWPPCPSASCASAIPMRAWSSPTMISWSSASEMMRESRAPAADGPHPMRGVS